MKFCKTILNNSNNIACLGVDKNCYYHNFEHFLTQQCVIFDQKYNIGFQNYLDIKDILNFYRIEKVEDSCLVCPNKNIDRYTFLKKKMMSIFNSYRISKIDIANYELIDLIPQKILEEFILLEIDIIKEFYFFMKTKSWFGKVEDFFINKAKTNVIKKLNYPITTTDGTKKINLTFAANFRFKSLPNSFNVFNLQKEKRHKLIPQDKNSIIYYADFKQFEFRTFLMLHPDFDINFDNNNLYEEFSKKLNLDDAKIQIISYLYGKRNDKIDKILNKNKILDSIQDNEFYCWNGYPVIIRKEDRNSNKVIHTIVQTISQYIYLNKLDQILTALDKTRSSYLFPLHDSHIISLNKEEVHLLKVFDRILNCDIFRVQECVGTDFGNLIKLNEENLNKVL